MEPILKTVAREYLNRYSNLKNFCFLFPNKRCGIFLKKYLAFYGCRKEDLPHILTITELTSQIAHLTEAGKIIQLFSLFNAYKEILGDTDNLDFDKFRLWGETVLSDFNTVDFALADPEEIFKNIKDYREISSNFLTDDQKEVMREYFGIQEVGDSSSFWKNFQEPPKHSLLKERFLNLWQILYPLYIKFHTSLTQKGLSSAGYIYRKAYERLKEKGIDVFPYKKIITIGFNALTEAERCIFKEIRDLEGSEDRDNIGDFIWDATGPLFNNTELSASKFIQYNIKHFPSPKWWTDLIINEDKSHYPEITIISSPATTSQAKIASALLREFNTPEQKKMLADAEVALVLPDEALLNNILYSIPDDIHDVNLTMGYSMKGTPIAAYLSLLRRLYATSREIKGENIYFAKDLKGFLSHPYSFILLPAESINGLMEYVAENHKINLSYKELVNSLGEYAEYLSFPSKKEEPRKIFESLDKIIRTLLTKMEANQEADSYDADISQIRIYGEYLESLKETMVAFEIKTSSLSIMQLADRIIANEKIGFEGEPLSGLQVMGTLETRAIDFSNVIILSMNEGIMPGKSFSSTFIPDTLRKAYGLPPIRIAEELFSYYFYRLISRAEKVTLIYDGRTNYGLKGGVSRYIMQLRQYYPSDKLKELSLQYNIGEKKTESVSIHKTPLIKEKLEAYISEAETGKNLSASSLNTYRECQVRFFLQNVMDINSDPEPSEYMGAIEIGNILHATMMDLYLPESKQKKLLKEPVIVTSEFLDSILSTPGLIRKVVQKNINSLYYSYQDNANKEIESGVARIISNQIEDLARSILQYDKNLTPFRLYGCEISRNIRIKLKSGKMVNFRFAIDRLDEVNLDGIPKLRIIDYKTGSRKREADSIESIFDGNYKSEQIFQLFTYAWLLGKQGIKGWEDVVTEIYYVPDLIKGRRGLPKINNNTVESFTDYSKDFGALLEEMIESIYNDPEFCESKHRDNCTWCPFVSVCGK